jgi:hypothetical protein
MQNTTNAKNPMHAAETTFDAPELTPIGDTRTIIMGMPGGGFDGAYSMTEGPFEFEADDVDL